MAPVPSAPDAVLQEIADALAKHHLSRALPLAERLLGQGVKHPLLYRARAAGREAQGRLADALGDLQEARRLAPDDSAVLNASGLALMRAGKLTEAAACLGHAVAVAPGIAESHHNLGLVQLAAGMIAAAGDTFKRTAVLAPDRAGALAQLALLAAHRGDWEEAADWGSRALSIDPREPNAIRALAEAEMGRGDGAAAETRLRAWLARSGLPPETRYHAWGLLGDALDGQGRAAEAFACYASGNSEYRRLFAPSFDGRRGRTLPAMLQGLKQAFDGPALNPAPPSALDRSTLPRRHVFLVGFMRSGTTLLEQALGNHPDVVTLEEYEALAESTRAFLSDPAGVQALRSLDAKTADQHRQLYWNAVREQGVEPAGRVFIDKHPFNAVKLPLIATLFPEAQVIFALRDPRDVVLSCFRHRLRLSAFTFEMLDLTATARLYDACMDLVERYKAKLNVDLIYHRHEDLISDFDADVRALCERIGLSWTDALRDVGARVRQGLTVSQSAAKVRRGVNDSGLAQWRRYEAQLKPVMPLLQRWVETFGYASG